MSIKNVPSVYARRRVHASRKMRERIYDVMIDGLFPILLTRLVSKNFIEIRIRNNAS